jgi:hypothetical protein
MRPASLRTGLTLALVAISLSLSQAAAQTDAEILAHCTPVKVAGEQLPGRPLELYGVDKVYVEDMPPEQFPAKITLFDCGDPKFLSVRSRTGLRLVRRYAIFPPNLPNSGCMCPSAGGKQTLSAPGAAPWPICPVTQCPTPR